jgi:hypothetical protein
MDLQAIREKFQEGASDYREERDGDNNAFCGLVMEDGTYHELGPYVCHGNLGDGYLTDYTHKGKKIKYVLSAVMCPHMKEGDLWVFFDWLVNRSPWAAVFIEKSVDSILQYGHVVDANNPANWVVSALIASRFGTESYSGDSEFQNRNKVWKELLSIGCSENEAYFFAQMYAPENNSKLYPIQISLCSSGHTPFTYQEFNEGYAKSFLEGKPKFLDDTRILADGRGYAYETIDRIWGSERGGEHFWNNIRSLVPTSKAQGKDRNIFRAIEKRSWSYTNQEDFKSIIGQLRELIYRG